MNVNLNNLRIKACANYENLCDHLNKNIFINNLSRKVVIDVDDIQTVMDDLRMNLVVLALSFIEDSEEFANLSDKIGILKSFNEVEDGDE